MGEYILESWINYIVKVFSLCAFKINSYVLINSTLKLTQFNWNVTITIHKILADILMIIDYKIKYSSHKIHSLIYSLPT